MSPAPERRPIPGAEAQPRTPGHPAAGVVLPIPNRRTHRPVTRLREGVEPARMQRSFVLVSFRPSSNESHHVPLLVAQRPSFQPHLPPGVLATPPARRPVPALGVVGTARGPHRAG